MMGRAATALMLTLAVGWTAAVPSQGPTIDGVAITRSWSIPREQDAYTDAEVDQMFSAEIHPRLQELSVKQVGDSLSCTTR